MYEITIGTGTGVFYVHADRRRVQFELANLPEGWSINVFDMTDKENPRLCDIKEFDE